MVLVGSAESGSDEPGSRAPTRGRPCGGIGCLDSGPLRPPSSPVCAWSVETILMDLDGEGDESASYATRLWRW